MHNILHDARQKLRPRQVIGSMLALRWAITDPAACLASHQIKIYNHQVLIEYVNQMGGHVDTPRTRKAPLQSSASLYIMESNKINNMQSHD